MTTQPLVSVLMTAFNREKYIAEAINSVCSSTYKNFELIIVDDGSTDNTISVAKEFAKTDNRIHIYCNKTNLGDYPNRNKAAGYATGKYIKYLDSDDVIYPWGLAAMVYCMEQYPEADYGLISYGIKSIKKFPILLTPQKAYYNFFFYGAMIITGPTGAIFTRAVFEKEGGFSGKPYVGDTEMWLKLSMKYAMVAMPLDLVWWRQHEGQQFKEGTQNNYYEHNSYSVYLAALMHPDCPFNDKYKKAAARNLKNRYARNLIIHAAKGKLFKFWSLFKIFKLNFS